MSCPLLVLISLFLLGSAMCSILPLSQSPPPAFHTLAAPFAATTIAAAHHEDALFITAQVNFNHLIVKISSSTGAHISTFANFTDVMVDDFDVDRDDNVVVAVWNQRGRFQLLRLAPDGHIVQTINMTRRQCGVRVDSLGNIWSATGNAIVKLDGDGRHLLTVDLPRTVALSIDIHDQIYVAVFYGAWHSDTHKFSAQGKPLDVLLTNDTHSGLSIGRSGDLFISIYWDSQVKHFDHNGKHLNTWDIPLDGEAVGIGMDRHGTLYVGYRNGGSPKIVVFPHVGIESV